jgi:H-type lectin domain
MSVFRAPTASYEPSLRGMSSIAPLVMLSAVVPMDSSAPDWTLQASTGPRSYSHDVVFAGPFSGPPVVHLGIVGVDSSRDHNLRLRVRAENIAATGFTIVVETWWETVVYGVDVSWLAIGS